MSSYNRVIIMGNLTRDPEVKYTTSNKAVAQLGLAINETWKDGSGQKQESTTFVDVEVWGSAAEFAGKYLTKGRPVLIEGRLKLDTWEDKQGGGKRSKLKVIADKLTGLGGRDEGGSQRPSAAKPAAAAPAIESDAVPF